MIEDVLLLPVEIVDGEAVEPQRLERLHPAAHGRVRDREQLRVEPGLGLFPSRKQQLHLLPPRVDGVVALVFVVAQRREIPDAVGELSELLGHAERRDQRLGPLRQRPLERGVAIDPGVEAREALLPLLPAREDVGEVPLEPLGDVGALAAAAGRRLGLGHVRRMPGHVRGMKARQRRHPKTMTQPSRPGCHAAPLVLRIQAATTSMISSSPASAFLPGALNEWSPPATSCSVALRQRRKKRRDLSRGAERVARALHEEHRFGDGGQVRVAPLIGFARWMQRIAEEDESGQPLASLRRDVRGDAAAHRFPADEKRDFGERRLAGLRRPRATPARGPARGRAPSGPPQCRESRTSRR